MWTRLRLVAKSSFEMQPNSSPKSVRTTIREGKWTKPTTSGICPGYLQANLVIIHKTQSNDFEKFCRANPQPCPLLAVLPPGEKEASRLAPGSDLTTDLPKYRVFRKGQLSEEVTNIKHLWTDDLVVFLIGCSFSFEGHLMCAGIPVRNIEQSKNATMFTTSRVCAPVGQFSGCPLVVSYRPIPSKLVERAVEITNKFGAAHGPPVHIGDPGELGIVDILKPDFGDPVIAHKDDVPMFWACGVTSTLAAISGQSDLVITHAPGHMFITDISEFE